MWKPILLIVLSITGYLAICWVTYTLQVSATGSYNL